MSTLASYRRGEVLRRVERAANQRLDGVLPTDIDGVAETFRDDLELVGILQLRWHTVLAGNIERALAEEPGDEKRALQDEDVSLEQVVLTAWFDAAIELAGVRKILDHHNRNPLSAEMAESLDIANRKDWALMALMSGLANAQDAEAAEVGRILERKVRSADFEPIVAEPRRLTLRERLRVVMAA